MPGNVDQRRADVDANDFIKSLGEGLGMAARTAAGIQGPASMTE